MPGRALIIGGTGQIGQAAARQLLADGWTVTLAQRDPGGVPEDLAAAGARTMRLDREEAGGLKRAMSDGGGFDAVIDTVAYDGTHARQLLQVQDDVGAFVVISSGSVYCDARGRTLDEAAQNGFPSFPTPIAEDQPTVAPGPETYSTRKAQLERVLLDEARRPAALLRAGAVHGPGSRHPREWWYVKRILDGRRRIPLAYAGESRFHTAATVNIAALIATVLETPITAALNAGDPEPPSVAGIGAAIARACGVDLELVPLPGPPDGTLGATPWSIPRPIVFDMSRAEALGYCPAATYAEAVAGACRSAEAAARAGVKFPDYIGALFDYAAEDAFFAGRR
ncbi:MAG TPA: NAD-dependent epimerase/dehydratase family protein [Caulobacteraceae bacterium]|nr:NAD-dependent epimerase/dehydratase family protein [Caulobacteraceae bacterium]